MLTYFLSFYCLLISFVYSGNSVQLSKFKKNSLEKFDIEKVSSYISKSIKKLEETQLNSKEIQLTLNSLPKKSPEYGLHEKLELLLAKFEKTFNNFKSNLSASANITQNYYEKYSSVRISPRINYCCNLKANILEDNDIYTIPISFANTCDLYTVDLSKAIPNPGRNLTSVFRQNSLHFPNGTIRWQYFIGANGVQNEYPSFNPESRAICRSDEQRHIREYMSSTITSKNIVVIVIDSGSMTEKQFELGKSAVKYFIQVLGRGDLISVFNISDRVDFVNTRNSSDLYGLSENYRNYLLDSINKLQLTNRHSNHTLGLETAFNVIKNAMDSKDLPLSEYNLKIIYLSSGTVNGNKEETVRVVKEKNSQLNFTVVINTYVLAHENKVITFEHKFMKEIAGQTGHSKIIKNANEVKHTFDELKAIDFREEYVLHWPKYDKYSKGVIIALSKNVNVDTSSLGVVGMDIDFAALFEDFFSFQSDLTYAFLMNLKGETIIHPKLGKPSELQRPTVVVKIDELEESSQFPKTLKAILRSEMGSKSFEEVERTNSKDKIYKVKYVWKKLSIRIERSPLILVLKSRTNTKYEPKIFDSSQFDSNQISRIRYYRLDSTTSVPKCYNFKQLATNVTSTLFLAPKAFVKSYKHLKYEEADEKIASLLLFLNQKPKMNLQSKSLHKEIRGFAKALSTIGEIFSKSLKRGWNKRVVRKMIAASNGVMFTFPGTLIDKSFDPTQSQWFRGAIKQDGGLSFTSPYLDVGGAGYIITLSRALSSSIYRKDVVSAMDLTADHLYNILLKGYSTCHKSDYRCFLVNSEGYIVAHRNLVMGGDKILGENIHINHKETHIARHLLYKLHILQKRICNDYIHQTVQYSYAFNESLNKTFYGSNGCMEYKITPVKDTNLFLIVSKTDKSCQAQAFCYCNQRKQERKCITCFQENMSVGDECKCPCECPLKMDYRTNQVIKSFRNYPSCEAPYSIQKSIDAKKFGKLRPCIRVNCGDFKKEIDCMGIMDCVWCNRQKDGKSLTNPYCTRQQVCFAGILGGDTPYHNNVDTDYTTIKPIETTPIGPIAGGIMGLLLAFALIVYCVRHQSNRHEMQYISTCSDPQQSLRMSHIEQDLDDLEDSGNHYSAHTNTMLIIDEGGTAANISPYKMNPNYKRPNNQSQNSDHGYSTMTPLSHDDAASFTNASTRNDVISRRSRRPPPKFSGSKAGCIPPPPRRKDSADKAKADEYTRLSANSLVTQATVHNSGCVA
ncbi:DgyrCDS3050 [Dimorphilus gyrociliatus]|uniref:DgyrCDS3050 n=1 Tax=Dimorphilus gyrociliatus TaxID=2664684 RepID=A0A7I8VCF4_9ANNE|nr:DgyrCDS3050 [Dimorphilus gyrociliatus]